MTYTLVFYLLLNGSMATHKIPQPDEFTCTRNAAILMSAQPEGNRFKPMHAECQPRKAPKKGKAP